MTPAISNNDAQPVVAACRNISKWYGPVIALNDVSLELRPGIFGLVGPNGAGKSTLIRLLTGQLRPSMGNVEVYGLTAWSAAAKQHIGYCSDSDAFHEEMSGRAFVRHIAQLHGASRAAARIRSDEVLELVGMSDRCDRPLASYSKGMRQRIKLAQALVHSPDLLVLDEPLNGVDPVGRVDFIRLCRELARQGKAVLISSHILDEMDKLADRVLFLSRGRILASGSLAEIRNVLEDHPIKVRIGADKSRSLAARLMQLDCTRAVEVRDDNELLVQVQPPRVFFQSFAELAAEEEFGVQRFRVVDASTEAILDYLTQRTRPR